MNGTTNFKVRWIGLLLCFIAGKIRAQDNDQGRVHWGLTAPVTLKLRLLPSKGNSYGVWGNTGLYFTQVIDGIDDNALSLMYKLGFTYDASNYPLTDHGVLTINRGSLCVNPEILFPTRYPRLKFSAGFGVEWNGYFLAQTDNSVPVTNDMAFRELDDSRRRFFPFLSGSLRYAFRRDFFFQVILKQALLNYFAANTDLYLGTVQNHPDAILYERPTYLGFAFSYFFR